ncbi:unnamed protein product [Darwinula stevensoni]|uniref:Major facilitator superfamily (MFS) profile domain-containing protein n=1 Tax=Darwinula stevensoni TaxID=69355 RepID=A0A7R8XA72_9CRUS|nr:unnamed protein product [Darwinula stevensoni]CAG0885264.1 unnamed protein product [Darwinula stevensoni]
MPESFGRGKFTMSNGVEGRSACPYESLPGQSGTRARSQSRDMSPSSLESFGSMDSRSPRDPGLLIEMTAAVAGVVPDDTFTVDQAVNALGFGRFQIKLSLITGLCWMTDSMEMMILSVLAPALHCAWGISEWKQAFVTSMVFMGMMLSSPFWGNFSDRYGRKMGLLIASWLLSYFGLLSATAPTYVWLVLLRGLVGFAIGCVPQSVTLYAEFLPLTQRAKCVVLLDCFWAMGACFEVLLALFIMPTLGWRWLLAISAIPVFISAFICCWMPESARYHATSGQSEKALNTLRAVASSNRKPMLLGRLIVDDVEQWRRGRIADLLVPELKWTSLILWFIWFTCAFCYYGVVLMTTELFELQSRQGMEGTCLAVPALVSHPTDPVCNAQCKELESSDYVDLLWTSLAEFPGILLTLLIIEWLGRKRTMALEFFVFALSVVLLFFCYSGRTALTAILFVARGVVAGVFQAAYVYTPEVYPTSLRAAGVGTCSGLARMGAMVTPFIAQVLIHESIHVATAMYAGLALLASVACLLLPIETKGREMTDSHT